MKPINWIVLGILTACSIVFVALYFMLGFNLVDWPSGLVLGIVWWAAIIAVAVCLFLQKRHFDKQDGALKPSAKSDAPGAKGASAAKKVPVGSAVVTAILVPTLVLCPYFSTNFSYADEAGDKAASSSSSSSAASSADAAAQTDKQRSAPDDHNDPWYYMLSPESTGVYLMYSIKGAPLKQLEPGEVLSASHQDAVEFFVRPKTGYLTDSTFLHSGDEHGFVTPNATGTYSKVGTNELPGFENATKEALEAGCTKEFHYSFREGAPWRYYIYREFNITVKPFAVKAIFDLNGGTIDGKATYGDRNTYYGPNVEGHADDDTIKLPDTDPVRKGYDFLGWTAGSSDELHPSGSAVDIDDYWRYLYDHSNDSGATLPIEAQWKQEEASDDKPADTPSDTDGSVSGSDSSSASSSNSSSSSSSGTAGSDSGSADNAAPGGTAGTGTPDNSGTTEGDASSSEKPSGSANATEPGDSAANGSDGTGTSGDLAGTGAEGDASTAAPDATDEEPGSLRDSPVTTQGTVTGNPNPATGTTGVNNATAAIAPEDNPMSGDAAHGLKLAGQQRTAGTLAEDTPLKDGITAGANALRDGIYIVEDLIVDDPLAMGYGISYANRGCWVCDYLKAGIVITLLYGAIVLVYRAARRGRASDDAANTPTSPTTIGASAA